MPNWKKVIVSGSNAVLNNITASGAISASGLLYASLSYDNTSVTNGVVAYDTATGQLYYTGSYSGEDTDWYVNDGTLGDETDFITSSRFVKVSDQALYINSGTVSNNWGFNNNYKSSIVGSSPSVPIVGGTPVPSEFEPYTQNTQNETTPHLGYTGTTITKTMHTFVTAQSYAEPDTTIYPVCLTGKDGEGPAPTGLNEGHPYNYLVFNPGFKYEIDPTDPPPPPPPPGDDDPHPTDDTGLGGNLIVDGGFIVKSSPITRSSPSSSLPPFTGSNEAPPAVVIRPQGGIFFFETGSTLSSSGSYLAASASARILYSTSSKALSLNVGTKDPSDLIEVMFVSKSGINPRVGIGTTSPKRTLDISSTSDDIFGGELVLEGQRTNVGGVVNDEGGRITYAIRSGSFKGLVSGSIGTIVGVVDDIAKEGVQGSLSFRISQDKTSEPQQVLKLVGVPYSGPTVEVTGSTEFSSDVTIRGNLTIDGIVDSDISSSGGISASKDIQTGQDVIAQNFVISEGGQLETINGGEYVALQTGQIALGFGNSWTAYFKLDEGFIFNDINTGIFGENLVRDFRVKGFNDSDLFLISGANATVGIGTSTPDEKLTVDGNIKASGNIIAVGDIIAQNYIVSSSVTYMTQSFSSGSTIFGDTLDDTHQFTGSVDITGSLIVDGMTYPTTDGTVNQVLTTDGSGNLSFQTLLEFTGSVGVSGSIEGVDYIDFSTSASVAYNEGRLFYDKENGSLGFYNEVADITLQVGQEFYKRARNESGATITNGTPVRISGSQGDYPLIYPAFSQNIYSGSYDAQENKIIGIATHNIEHLTEGYITEFGIVRNVDTTAFAAGDQLYLQTGSGGFRNTPPPFPFDVVPVGEVIRSQANGFIEVRTSEPITSENISGIINIETEVISDESTTIQKGTPVHVVSEGDGPIPRVKIAKASDANLMPATFVVTEAIPSASQGTAISTGYIFNVDTSAFTVGDVIFVAPDGGYTNQKPTGSNLIQNLGVVLKVSATEGSGFVYGAGRANDVPNISPGYAWVGNSNNVATAVATSSFVVTTANTASYVAGSNVDGAVGAAVIATTAATSDQIDINNTSNDQNYGLVFRSGNTDGYQQVFADNQTAQPSYNPSNNTITTPIISASSALYVSGNITVEEGDITTNTISNVTTVIGSDSATNVDTFNTSSYTGAIYDYVLIDTTVGARAGQFMIAQDNGSVTFTDNSTRHLFDTTEPEISGQINGSNVEVQVTNGNGYTFKSFVKKL